jgi:hypothetical protein
MIPLLKLAIEAHGGLERWRQVHGIDLKLTVGGGYWQLKGLPQGLVDVALHVEPALQVVVQAGASHFCLECETVGGIVFPTHRRASRPRFETGRAGPFGSSGYRTHDQKYPVHPKRSRT